MCSLRVLHRFFCDWSICELGVSLEHQQDEVEPISAVSDDDTVFDEHSIHFCQLSLQGGAVVHAENVLADTTEDFLRVAPSGCGFWKHVSSGNVKTGL